MYPISQFLIYRAFFFFWHLNHCVSLDSVLSLGGISVVTIFICIHIFCSLTVKKEKGYIFYALVNINSFLTCWFLKFPWRNSNLILLLRSHFFFCIQQSIFGISFDPTDEPLTFMQESPWSSSLLGSPSPWTTHQDNRTKGKDSWCLQEALSLKNTITFLYCWPLFHFLNFPILILFYIYSKNKLWAKGIL